MIYWNLFLAFFRVGIFGYGGGPASIPLVEKEVVKQYKWMDDEEFGNTLALGNSLPGPIATKLAGYIGYKVGGWFGMICALVATVIPTVVLLIILFSFVEALSDQPWIRGMTTAVIPVVGVMLAVMTIDFLKKSRNGLKSWQIVALLLASVVLIELLHIHPALLILALLLFALLKPEKQKEEDA
ncbi:chromate transporter [Terribacillus aidingensis]|uniref:Chromate transporter n=1 Tax=Terribacillus aidingensis TaxID=586416 RepID=A0A285N694_9BACI|nr:chromate transporter [Terribacillus aidingensis]SNZ04972.1 chromate transporter [Terribacillus aidingensis]